MENVIEQHWAVMGKYDPKHHIKLIVDEWGVWYRPGEELAPAYQLSQPLTLRDALHTAVTLDVFNRQADKIAMANVAQTINCIHSLMLAQGDRYARTPPYYVFEMYRNHMSSRLALMKIRCDELKVPSRVRQRNHAWLVWFRVDEGRDAACDDYESLFGVVCYGALRSDQREHRRRSRNDAHPCGDDRP